MKKIIILLLFLPTLVFAQDNIKKDQIFKARVVEVQEESVNILLDGTEAMQQKIKLMGLEGEYKDKEVIFDGVSGYDVIKKNIYKEGDIVLTVASYDDQGEVYYYITDYVRSNSLLWLFFIFIVSVAIIGKWKGLRSIVSLILTFLVIIKFILPNILAGKSPLMITFFGSIIILIIIIYLTEGINKKSHVCILSTFFSLLLVIIFSKIFVAGAKLSGLASEEVSFLVNLGDKVIDFQGLLLAGIIIGALGVLDDIIISQVATVEQISQANQNQTKREIFNKAYKVGVSHISSMTNTLFLAYAGASLPLLLLFVSGESAFNSWAQIINNEAIATEIVRTLAGSIGLILSVPIATIIAILFIVKNK